MYLKFKMKEIYIHLIAQTEANINVRLSDESHFGRSCSLKSCQLS
jgi:hypothetical protein